MWQVPHTAHTHTLLLSLSLSLSPSSERREVGVREGAREGVAEGVLPVIPCTSQLEYFWV